MGKGYNNYMCKKPFHPGSKQNIKRAWMAEQKTENEKRKQEELKVQYEKEQDLYTNRAMISSESKDKLELNFMYEAPPGAKRERQKEDDEPEYKFEWQRKYNAPREDYAKGNSDIKDQPFGIPVRNVRCIKCHKWGHINTDRECPLFSQASTSSMPTTSMDPMELMRQMREDGFGLKEHVLGHQLNPKAANQQFLQSDESDPEAEFLKSLSVADKKKLLRKLKKLSKKQKSKKKKSKKLHKSRANELSESEGEKRRRTKKIDTSSSSSSSSSDDDSKRKDDEKSAKRKKHRESRSSSRDSYTNKKRNTNTSFSKHESSELKSTSYSRIDKNSSSKHAKNQKEETPKHYQTKRRHRESRSSSSDTFSNGKREITKSNASYKHDTKEQKSMSHIRTDSKSSHRDAKHQNGEIQEYSQRKTKKHKEYRSLSGDSFDKDKIEKRKSVSYSKNEKNSSTKDYKHKKEEKPKGNCKPQGEKPIKAETDKSQKSKPEESKYKVEAGTAKENTKDFEKSSVEVQSSWKPNYSSSSNSETDDETKEIRAAKQKDADSTNKEKTIRIKIEKPDSEATSSIDKNYHPDGFSHLSPQTLIKTNYLLAAAEYKGTLDDIFRDTNRDERSPSVKQKYKS